MTPRILQIIGQSLKVSVYLLPVLAIISLIRVIPYGILAKLFSTGRGYRTDVYDLFIGHFFNGIFPLIGFGIALACTAAICEAIENKKSG